MKIKLGLFVLLLLFVGCAPKSNKLASSIYNASLGMNKQEVINVMGPPESVSAKDNTEVLRYELCTRQMTLAEGPSVGECTKWTKFFIRLINGKVESYGELGDFDSTKTPELKQTIDITVK